MPCSSHILRAASIPVGKERQLALAPLPIKRIHDRWISGYAEAAVELIERLSEEEV